MEAEVRAILTDAVAEADEHVNLAQAIRQRFGAIGEAEIEVPPRCDMPRSADLQDRS